MTMTVKDANGQDIEVYTSDELQVQKQAALDEYVAANPDNSGEITKLQDELVSAKKSLEDAEKAGKGGENVKQLRDAKENLEKGLKDMEGRFMTELEKVKNSGLETYKNDLIKAYSKEDSELKKKIEFNLGQFKNTPTTQEDMKNQILSAVTLSIGKAPDNFNFSGMNSGNSSDRATTPAGEIRETENGKMMRNVLGISDAEAKKYGSN